VFERLRRIGQKPTPAVNPGPVDEARELLRDYERRGTEAVRKDPSFRQRLGCLMTTLAPLIELHDYLEFMDKASQLIDDYEKQGAQTISKDQSFRRRLEKILDSLSKSRSAKIVNSSQADKLKKIDGILKLVDKALQLNEKYINEGEEVFKGDQSSLEELCNATEIAKLDPFIYAQFRATEICMIIESLQAKFSPVRRAHWVVRTYRMMEEGTAPLGGIYSIEFVRKEAEGLLKDPILEGMPVKKELERILRDITKEKPQP
jgi:hypothetical protein